MCVCVCGKGKKKTFVIRYIIQMELCGWYQKLSELTVAINELSKRIIRFFVFSCHLNVVFPPPLDLLPAATNCVIRNLCT